MPVIFTRIDDRLIHGQVVQGWLPALKADECVVVLEDADQMSKDLLRLALPPEYGLRILNAADAAQYIKNSAPRVFLLAGEPEDLDNVMKNGPELKSVNIGGMHFRDGRDRVLKNVYMTPQEKDFIKNLINRGVDIDSRSVPAEPRLDVKGILCG